MSTTILKELQHRNLYFKLAVIFNLLLFGFLWLNGHLQRGSELEEHQGVYDYVSSLNPPELQINATAIENDPAFDAIKDGIIVELKNVTRGMQNDEELNKFATLLGNQAAGSGWPEDYQISLLYHRAFPRQENRISADYIELHLDKGDAQQKIEDTARNWKTKSQKIGLDTSGYSKYGVGLAANTDKLFAVIFLVKPLLSFDQNFPIGGNVDLNVTLEDSSVSNIRIKRTDYSRGFLKEIDQQLDELTPSVSATDRTFKLELEAAPGSWSSIQFFIDGELSGFGRVIVPNKIDAASGTSTTMSASSNTAILVAPQQATSASGQLTALELAKFTPLLERVNQSRASHGLSALALDTVATKAALNHCQETVDRGYIGHWGINGSLPFHRYHAIGGNGHVSENLAWFCRYKGSNSNCNGQIDQSSANMISKSADMHNHFMAETPPDDGHRLAILRPEHTSVGLAYAVKDGAFAYCEEYVDKHATINPITTTVRVGQKFELKGKVDDPRKYGIDFISISYDSSLTPFLQNPQPSSYSDAGLQSHESFAPWDISYNQSNGGFSVNFTPDKPGLYYIQYSARKDPSNIPYNPSRSISYNSAGSMIAAAQLITVVN